MRTFAFVAAILGTVLGLATAVPAGATNVHSYVSSTGDDGNPCTNALPCQSLGTAILATVPDGEVSCLDGGLSSSATVVNITQSITIDCAGVPAASWTVFINGNGIVVTLRNLTLTSFSYGNQIQGIDFQNGAALFIENCVIERFEYGNSNAGIYFAPTSGTAKLYVTDSVIKNNGTATDGGGIIIQPAAGAEADVVIERSKVENNRAGIVAISRGTVHGAVRDSVVSGSTASWGIGVSGPGVSFLVENTTVTDNNVGLVAETKASILVSHSSIALNTNGLYTAGGGAITSYKNNNLNRNTHSDGAFTTTLAQQ
jgi:Periplasmic copper-binding protein (NosD)